MAPSWGVWAPACARILGGLLMSRESSVRIPFSTIVVLGLFAGNAHATLSDIGLPYNVLDGSIVASSTAVSLSFHPLLAVDDKVRATPPDQDHGLIFASFDADQRLGMTGNYGRMRKLRIWTIPIEIDQRIPNFVEVRSSVNTLTGVQLVTPGSFETALGTFPLGIGAFTGTAPSTDNTFATVAIDAPAGTQSLYLSFGAADFKGERITEVQAFIPEPGTLILAVFTILAMAGVRRR
jgi:hypothetical protein